jgi:glycerol kinase
VQRSAQADSTALGAATLAGLAAGVWSSPDELPEVAPDLATRWRS